MELSWERPGEGWRGISRAALSGWLLFYALFLWHAATNRTGFLLLDYVNLIFHEAGHFFFGWFGYTIGILGGTLGELIVPAGVATYFIRKCATAGTAFASFWFFENFLYVGTYMADARSLALPLVGSGEHDWEILFGQWGVLVQDRAIGGAARTLGWIGMLATLAGLVCMCQRATRSSRSQRLPTRPDFS